MNRRALLIGFAALALLAAGLARLGFDAQVLNLLPAELPVVRDLQTHQKYFANRQELIVTVQGPDAGAVDAAAGQLGRALERLTNLVAEVHYRTASEGDPAQAAELLAWLWLNQPPDALRALEQKLAAANLPALLAAERERLATSMSPDDLAYLGYDPYGLARLPGAPGVAQQQQQGFGSADGTFRLVFALPRAPLKSFDDHIRWTAALRAACATARQAPDWPAGVALAFTGPPAFMAEIAQGMQRDITGSALGTLALVLLLFWWAHRSWRPLGWLGLALALVVGGTLAFGGLVFGRLNVVSMGFAAILIGLVADYALIYYQEARAEPGLTAPELRARLGRGIWWSAATTAAAFGLLMFAGLPGLRQLGALIAAGVLLSAVIVQYLFLPLVLRSHPAPDPRPSSLVPQRSSLAPRLSTPLLLLFCAVTLGLRPPRVDHSNQALQPLDSPAQAAMDELKARLNQSGEPWFVLASGATLSEVGERIATLDARLRAAQAQGRIGHYELPLRVWPHPDRQDTNRAAALRLAARAPELRAAALAHGFSTNACALTDGVLAAWQRLAATPGVIWPAHPASRWLLGRAIAQTDQGWLALGVLHAPRGVSAPDWRAEMDQLQAAAGVRVAGWERLGDELLRHVEPRIAWLTAALALAVGVGLWRAFGNARELALSAAALALSVAVLLAIMGWAGWAWNLMNLTALPLLLGAGVDYSIHVQLALRRQGGDLAAVRRVTGRALFLCAATTVAGFGSLGFAGNAGLASLGRVCAAGLGVVYLVSVWLLPHWWRWANAEIRNPKSE